MNFLQPIWLYAMAGIIIPIAIHFWNIKEGKALPVGSIALLEKSTKKYTRTFRINEWLLLILRCLLIILLAMLLAKPVKQQKLNNKGWILIDGHNTNLLYDHFKTTIDSLLGNGFELHHFDEGFEEISLDDALANEDTGNSSTPYWPLIKNADNELPSSFPIYVFTDNKLKHFKGEKPQVNAAVKWFAYSGDTIVQQLVNAWKTDGNNIRVMLANSTSSGNMFSYEDIAADQTENNEYKITSGNNRLYVSYNNQTPVMVDTAAMHISIYTGSNNTDANYIKASLDAIKTFTRRNIQTTISGSAASIPKNTDWLFWLSNENIPANIKAQNIFRYTDGKTMIETSFIHTNPSIPQSISINKRVIADTSFSSSSQTIWTDGFGNPLLVKINDKTYNFYSRFNPQWNALVWNEAFPSILLQWIFNDDIHKIGALSPDERAIDITQIQPVFISNQNKIIASATEDLSTVCWIIIFLVFCAERIISFKTKTKTA